MNIKENMSLVAKELDRKTVSRILGHIEKYCTEIENVEELLWNLLDEIDNKKYTSQKQEIKKLRKSLKSVVEMTTDGSATFHCDLYKSILLQFDDFEINKDDYIKRCELIK